ncbi:hypothetical protein PENARI_c003G06789 [Penicillium arizonense]|uniref:Uncharacterized protein n=1 Tax=Penicillium arizonense TaxID=1835702 RepID=A0A1F5LUY5_PENAI|nr:hypothetical protein PENARI_c003G06789 [Penicillium arizonense]
MPGGLIMSVEFIPPVGCFPPI